MQIYDVIVVGAGAGGMMAAARAAHLLRLRHGPETVALFEKNASAARKLGLTGKGRCNVTNDCPLADFLAGFGENGPFLRDAFKHFFVPDLVRFFAERGVGFKRERQGRMFPESDSSRSIVEALKEALKKEGAKVFLSAPVAAVIVREGRAQGVRLRDGSEVLARTVILATGGASYPETGSTGDGYCMAEKAGHVLTRLYPGLVPLETTEKFVEDIKGLVLRNVAVIFRSGRKEVRSGVGELLFTHFGISGPLVLDLSASVAPLFELSSPVLAQIDLKPGLAEDRLDGKLRAELHERGGQKLKNYLEDVLPRNFVPVFLDCVGVGGEVVCSRVSVAQRRRIACLLKRFPLTIKRPRPLSEAMVTCGGVSLKDIDPRTMMSRKVGGLFFCGEIMDLAARSGGFNLQAAFSTGHLAGESAALTALEAQ